MDPLPLHLHQELYKYSKLKKGNFYDQVLQVKIVKWNNTIVGKRPVVLVVFALVPLCLSLLHLVCPRPRYNDQQPELQLHQPAPHSYMSCKCWMGGWRDE